MSDIRCPACNAPMAALECLMVRTHHWVVLCRGCGLEGPVGKTRLGAEMLWLEMTREEKDHEKH